jgi:hypothetical protein
VKIPSSEINIHDFIPPVQDSSWVWGMAAGMVHGLWATESQ